MNYERKVVAIGELFLDPNNPRIVPLGKGKDTAEADIKNQSVQENTLRLMNETARSGIVDYCNKLKREGMLSAFPLRVAKLPGGGYVLNDGNTRVVAARQVLSDVAVGKAEVDSKILQTLKSITVEDVGEYGGTEWLKMQAKIHLQGPRTWESSKKAGFITKILRKRLTKEEIFDILQIKAESVNKYKAGLNAYFELQNTYPDRISENHFNVIKELMTISGCRRYLGYNQKAKTFRNTSKVMQFLHLISPLSGRPTLTAGSSKILRTLGDDAGAWDMAFRGREKDLKYLKVVTDKNKGINEMLMKLAVRLENMQVREVNNLDLDLVTRVVSLCNRAKTQARAITREKVAA